MMVQAMIFQYACLNLGVNWSMLFNNNQIFSGWFFGGLIVLTFNTAAYMGEIVQSGLNGVGKDQTEGARSLGMSEFKTLFIVELPQALKNAIPTIGNEWIVNIKDSSVLNIVGVTELFFMAKNTAGQSYKILATYLIIAVIYLFLTLITTLILKLVTMKLNHQKIKIKLFHFRKEYGTNEK
jgi:putative lysine transport system permease protein